MRDAIKVEASLLRDSFRINEAGYTELLKGPVVRDLVRRAVKVEAAAKNYATGRSGGPNVRTGRLRASITWRIGSTFMAGAPYVDVGTAVFYAPFVELGTINAPAYPFLRPALAAAR